MLRKITQTKKFLLVLMGVYSLLLFISIFENLLFRNEIDIVLSIISSYLSILLLIDLWRGNRWAKFTFIGFSYLPFLLLFIYGLATYKQIFPIDFSILRNNYRLLFLSLFVSLGMTINLILVLFLLFSRHCWIYLQLQRKKFQIKKTRTLFPWIALGFAVYIFLFIIGEKYNYSFTSMKEDMENDVAQMQLAITIQNAFKQIQDKIQEDDPDSSFEMPRPVEKGASLEGDIISGMKVLNSAPLPFNRLKHSKGKFLIDPWGTPYKISITDDNHLVVISAGPNRTLKSRKFFDDNIEIRVPLQKINIQYNKD